MNFNEHPWKTLGKGLLLYLVIVIVAMLVMRSPYGANDYVFILPPLLAVAGLVFGPYSFATECCDSINPNVYIACSSYVAYILLMFGAIAPRNKYIRSVCLMVLLIGAIMAVRGFALLCEASC